MQNKMQNRVSQANAGYTLNSTHTMILKDLRNVRLEMMQVGAAYAYMGSAGLRLGIP